MNNYNVMSFTFYDIVNSAVTRHVGLLLFAWPVSLNADCEEAD